VGGDGGEEGEFAEGLWCCMISWGCAVVGSLKYVKTRYASRDNTILGHKVCVQVRGPIVVGSSPVGKHTGGVYPLR